RLARLLDHGIELHVLIMVHGPVARAGDREADDALGVAEIPDDGLAGFGRVERQVEQALDALVLRKNALDQPAIVGAADGSLDVLLRVHAEHQHRRGKHHLVVEAHGIHGAAGQLGEMVALAAVDGLQQSELMGNAAVDVLERDPRLGVEQRRVGSAGPGRHRLAHLANDVVVDQVDDLRPELRLRHMRVDVDEEIILHPLGLDGGVREDVARVGLDGDLFELSDLLYRSLLHRRFSSLEGRSPMLDHLLAPVESDCDFQRAATRWGALAPLKAGITSLANRSSCSRATFSGTPTDRLTETRSRAGYFFSSALMCPIRSSALPHRKPPDFTASSMRGSLAVGARLGSRMISICSSVMARTSRSSPNIFMFSS